MSEEVLTKVCSKCGIEKPVSAFSKDNSKNDGLQIYCKECAAKSKKKHRNNNKTRDCVVLPNLKTCPGCELRKSGSAFNKTKGNKDGLNSYCKECALVRRRERLYGASPEWQKAMLEAQGGACAICKFVPGPEDRGLHLDHKHGEGPRGFLHTNCNFGLGHFKDSVEIIRKAIDYLNGPTTGIAYIESWGKRVPTSIKNKILADQNGLCKICSVDLHSTKACLDHCHITDMVRGYLCNNCNCGLSRFNDSVILLANAIKYLQKYEQLGGEVHTVAQREGPRRSGYDSANIDAHGVTVLINNDSINTTKRGILT